MRLEKLTPRASGVVLCSSNHGTVKGAASFSWRR